MCICGVLGPLRVDRVAVHRQEVTHGRSLSVAEVDVLLEIVRVQSAVAPEVDRGGLPPAVVQRSERVELLVNAPSATRKVDGNAAAPLMSLTRPSAQVPHSDGLDPA